MSILSKIFTSSPLNLNVGLLLLRLGLSAALLTHGWMKIENFSKLAGVFPDPFGTGHLSALVLAIISEVGGSILLILGLWTRAASLVLLLTFLTIFFIVSAGQPFSGRELPYVFLVGYAALLFTGAGSFSLDGLRRTAKAQS